MPVFQGGDQKKGVHINAVGAYTPETQEIPAGVVVRSKVFVDSRQAALEEAGDLIIPLKEGKIGEDHIAAEIGEVANGTVPGRQSEKELTLFKSVGLAVQDTAVAEFIHAQAIKAGLGQDVEI